MRNLLFTLLLLSTSLGAAIDSCGMLKFGAQGLYWQPLGCGINYAHRRIDGNPTINLASDFRTQYDWGFRLYAQYTNCNQFFLLTYSWYLSSRVDCTMQGLRDDPLGATNSLSILGSVNESPGGTGTLRSRYKNVDLQVGHILCTGCCGQLAAFGNLFWLDVGQRIATQWVPVDGEDFNFVGIGRYNQSSRFQGVGLGTGFKGHYEVLCGLQVDALLNALGVIGRQWNPAFNRFQLTEAFINERVYDMPGSSAIIPGVRSRIGLTWMCSQGCCDLEINIGWEIEYYWELLKVGDADINQRSNGFSCIDLGWSGPYFGGRILF